MRKNVASQAIGAQMVNASTGAAFTGSVTVYVTGDAGTQAVGSVGSGACTHEGNGYHTYAPAQAETNYDLIAFTFIGTGAIPATIQVFTTANLVDDIWDEATSGHTTAGTLGQAIIDILADTNELQTDNVPGLIAALNNLSQADIRTAVGLASANLDTQLATIAAYIDTEVAAILEDTGTTIPGLIAALNNISATDVWAAATRTLTANTNFNDPTAAAIAAEILTGSAMTESYALNKAAPTLAQAIFAIHQVLMAFAISGTSFSVKKLDGITEAFAGTLDDGTNPTQNIRS